ncbi:Beta-barrel assembly machine subunit BamF [Sphingobium faniae]|nr:Beta-barrel assembly machine subunit BamF [Sphingobium faniae]
MRKLILAAGLVASLSACGSSGLLNRDRPDEFAVSRQAPLVIPPDFALVPPAPGAPNTAAVDSSRAAMEAMFGGPAARSATESATLSAAGRTNAAPGIRSSAGDPATDVVEKGETTRDIIAAPEGDGQDARASVPEQ